MSDIISKFSKNLTIPVAIAVFASLLAVDIIFLKPVPANNPAGGSVTQTEILSGKEDARAVPKLSEIRGPQIDKEAAAVVKSEKTAICSTFPANVWVLILCGYLFLLVFNLAYGYLKNLHVQWFWEFLYTALAMGTWFYFDQCRTNLWFPLYVLKLGIIIYLFYLYFLNEKSQEKADTEPKA